jgi:hypothetical protein
MGLHSQWPPANGKMFSQGRGAAAATKPNKPELKQTEGKKMTGRGIRGRGMGKEQPLEMRTLPPAQPQALTRSESRLQAVRAALFEEAA